MNRTARIALRILIGILIFVAVLELALRLLTRDVEGHATLFRIKLLPFERLTSRHEELLRKAPEDLAYIIPDKDLGWTIKPSGRSEDGLYCADERGLRTGKTVAAARADARTVLLAGDSFTHGDELVFEDTWSAQLGAALGDQWRVHNAGVPGYGTDQALLRALELQASLAPEAIVLTLCRDDLLRNVNVLRSAYLHWTDMPWTKPRFVLEQGGGLGLLNRPCVAPADVAELVMHYDDSPLSRSDAVYRPGFHAEPWTDCFRLLKWLRSRREHRDRHEAILRLTQRGGEGIKVTAALVRLFCDSSRAAGRQPLVVLLPQSDDITRYRSGTPSVWQPLLEELEGEDPLVDLGPALLASLAPDEDTGALFVNGTGHPNKRASAVIARELALRLSKPR